MGIKSGVEKIKQRVATRSARTRTAGASPRAASATAPSTRATGLLRAAAAMAGIYGNDAVEALYPLLATDSEGNKPDCSKNRYTLTFPAGQLPPVNAFWSVTMYDGKTQLLVENPINRYLINSPMLPDLKKNADGSLTHLHPEGLAGQGQGVQLAARAGRPDLRGDAALLAEGRGARREVEAAGRPAGALKNFALGPGTVTSLCQIRPLPPRRPQPRPLPMATSARMTTSGCARRTIPTSWPTSKPRMPIPMRWTAGSKAFQESLYQEMLARIKEDDSSVPYRRGGHFYYSRTEKGKQYPIYCRKAGSLDAPEEIMLDLNVLAEGKPFFSLGMSTVSDDGNLLAYTTDITGFREYTLYIKDLRTGHLYPHDRESLLRSLVRGRHDHVLRHGGRGQAPLSPLVLSPRRRGERPCPRGAGRAFPHRRRALTEQEVSLPGHGIVHVERVALPAGRRSFGQLAHADAAREGPRIRGGSWDRRGRRPLLHPHQRRRQAQLPPGLGSSQRPATWTPARS